jgi:hypothetical protein
LGRKLHWLLEPRPLYPLSPLGLDRDLVSSSDDGRQSGRHVQPPLRTLFVGLGRKLTLQIDPTLSEVLILVFNFAACAPVWLCVSLFGMYHLWLASGNNTTIERWEKDKVATMVRRGKIKEIKYPYVSIPADGLVLTTETEHDGKSQGCTWS